MSALEPTAAADRRTGGATFDYQRLVNAVFAVFVFFGMMSVIEPSPYDFLTLLIVPLWFIGGFSIHRSAVPILLLWIVFEVAGFAALMPYWSEPEARLYQLQSLYLFVTVIFFTLFFAERTLQRCDLCLKAFTAGAIVCSIIGFAAYLDIGGIGPGLTTYEGRVSGTFKDPNVFGSYLVLAATYLMQTLLFGTAKRLLPTLLGVLVLVFGVFVSFSRGSWGAMVGAVALMIIAGVLTAETPHLRRRITKMTLITVAVGAVAILALLAHKDIRDFFLERAKLAQDYDEGVTGRFGNQLRFLPMIPDMPGGFGPLRFRDFFGLEPHNSYLGAFANDGWIGGFAWIWIVLMTCYIGFRLMFVRSPYRRVAQVFWPALFALLMQGFQIDVDHWRQVFLCFGAVWGLEGARLRWARRSAPVARAQPGPAASRPAGSMP